MFLFLAALLFLFSSTSVQAGCGCDKPPPLPAVVVPYAAHPGMAVTLYNSQFVSGQKWSVSFQSSGAAVSVVGVVVSKRSLTAPVGAPLVPQLVINVPSIPKGPASITATRYGFTAVTVPSSTFTVIGTPFAMPPIGTSASFSHSTAVGADGILYIAMSGLDQVCSAVNFTGKITNIPVQYGMDDISISNAQGFRIEDLGVEEAGHFVIQSSTAPQSSMLWYARHSFATYCTQHLPGGIKAVSSTDSNYHVDGTPHTSYKTLIFAIDGTVSGRPLTPGAITFMLTVTTDNP